MFKELDKRVRQLGAGRRNKENFINILSVTEDRIAERLADLPEGALAFGHKLPLLVESVILGENDSMEDTAMDVVSLGESEDLLGRILSAIRALDGYDQEKDVLGKRENQAATKRFLNLNVDKDDDRTSDDYDEIDEYVGYNK